MPFNSKAMPTNNINYNCHINIVTCLAIFMGFISHHIRSLVIYSLRSRHTHTHTHTTHRHTHTHTYTHTTHTHTHKHIHTHTHTHTQDTHIHTHTHTHTQHTHTTHTHTHTPMIWTESILRSQVHAGQKPAYAWFRLLCKY